MVNLSKKAFSNYEYSFLNKGLSFCPFPKQYNRANANKDFEKFFRRIKLRAHFGIDKEAEDEPSTEQEIFGIKSKSNWTPKYTDHTVETFIAAVKKDILNSPVKPVSKDNLSEEEGKALNNLKERDDVIFTKADKGGAVVIWDTKDYIEEAE